MYRCFTLSLITTERIETNLFKQIDSNLDQRRIISRAIIFNDLNNNQHIVTKHNFVSYSVVSKLEYGHTIAAFRNPAI